MGPGKSFLARLSWKAGPSLCVCAATVKLMAEPFSTCLTSWASADCALDSVHCGGTFCHRQRQRPGRRNLLLRLRSKALSSGNQIVLGWRRSAERDPCCPSWLLLCRSVGWYLGWQLIAGVAPCSRNTLSAIYADCVMSWTDGFPLRLLSLESVCIKAANQHKT